MSSSFLGTRIALAPRGPDGFPFRGLLRLVLLLLFAHADQGSPSSNRSMERHGSTSHLFDPIYFRTMILLFKLPDSFQGGRTPNHYLEDQTPPHWVRRAVLHANGTL